MRKKFAQLALATLPLVVAAMAAPKAEASSTDFFGRYNLGLGYATTTSYAAISYDAPPTAVIPDDCSASGDTSMRCTAYLAPDTSSDGDVTVYIDQPFKRTGWFYVEPGFAFSTLSYKGGITAKPTQQLKPTKNTQTTTKTVTEPPGGTAPGGTANATPAAPPTSGDPDTKAVQPLTLAYMEMYGINWQAYLRFGVTPLYLPDLLVTAGLSLQTVGGRLKIFTSDKTRYVVQPGAFAEAELVLVRAATGALSVYYGQETSLTTPMASQLIADYTAGSQLTNVQMSLRSSSAGVRLLFPF